MKYGLSDSQLQEIITFIRQYPEVEEAILFGSRAIDTFKEASDVDIALKGEKVNHSLAAKMKFNIEEDTYLPFFFDFVAYPTITNEALKKHINAKGIVLYRGNDAGLGEWRECRLGKHIYINSRSIDKNYPYKEIEYLDTGSITGGKIESLQHFELADAPSRAKRIVKDNDIVLSMVRPIQRHYGYLRNTKPNTVVSTGFVVLTNKESIDPYFLYVFLTQDDITEYLDVVAEGSTSAYPAFTPDVVENLSILLPPLPEQRAIAGVLSSLDDKIDLLHRQNKTLEGMAEILFRQWFIEEAKKEWEGKPLCDYVSVVDNRGKTPPNTEEYTPYPVIEVNALGKENRLVDYSVIKKYVDEETYNSWFRDKLQKFDILISTVGSIGAISMFIIELGNIAQNVIGLHAKDISPFFLYQILQYKTDEMMQMDIGEVQPSIKVPHLLSMLIPIPPKNIQDEFDNQLKYFVNKMEYNYNQIHTLEKLRDTLLPKLMSGEIKVEIKEVLL
ncbi:restriction endonuclease subunit S [Candidatus Desantisbacteria bacterium CG_4_9_14_3_um_filter_40_11]|uniref:Restriction endonuclease subunit S n=4 Tax=unclassified Candidatus Desantisiibacteriota TaxID=3106372 RepID=A0A2M7JCN7_9BACT|nr:MAG: restriction endonuclease subunit S [Candidatus Desantisbacteria bacterium CG23_combo_of_CG06-09_8_20_14_all_40_23]PIX17137.1 MAG: restriction endonuclease subunit S [Candidatus Desantisbacteria bacterium CG_4_8_14_3_um_filter_40_12]PIY20058.1 MAG: restriction endonuclease subunit S [Candidatus Desantisbacteria bacterium CG_4_10_14_3_um_filter_40_18]PJB29303.1 MAG: restriction endonuclease subunit S [Candidatus Desantisbacteria bacterium CG_4_9_14_3_um_filter_40_11]